MLLSCATTQPVSALQSDYNRLYAAQGRAASMLAEHKLAAGTALAIDESLRAAKAELDAGLTPQAERRIAEAEAQL